MLEPTQSFRRDQTEVEKQLRNIKKGDRASSVEAIETIQVISALLAGTGITFLDTVNDGDPSTLSELIRIFVMIFVGLNLYGLIVLSSTLFYLRQCMAKDLGMFDPFMDRTKNVRYWAIKGVLYSTIPCVFMIGLQQIKKSENSLVNQVGGITFLGLAIYCVHVMWNIRQEFAQLRKQSKSKVKFKTAGHAVRLAVARKALSNPANNNIEPEDLSKWRPSAGAITSTSETAGFSQGTQIEDKIAVHKKCE